MIRKISTIFMTGLISILTACSGGEGSSFLAEGGIGGTGVSLGSISGFGSVIVNGTQFEVTNNTIVSIDGMASSQDALKVGFVVRVEGDLNSGATKRIDYTETVRGRVDALTLGNLDIQEATLTILGQTLHTNALTSFEGISLDPTAPNALNVGYVIDVSGVRDANGAIVISFAGTADTNSEVRVTGSVNNLTATTFTIAGLTVDFGIADLPDGPIATGMMVQVKGASQDFSTSPSPVLRASSVKQSVVILNAVSGDGVEIEGVVTRFTSVGDFEINGQPADATTAQIENGNAADIKLNARMEAEGQISETGILEAKKVEIKPPSVIRIEANADSVDTASNTVTLLGIPVRVNSRTRLEDDSNASLRPFSLADINSGDRIESRGFLDGINVVASRLEREDSDDDFILQAPVEAKDEAIGSVTLLGVTIRTDSNTEFKPDRNDFFTQITLGQTVVKAKWKSPSLAPDDPAEELSIEEN